MSKYRVMALILLGVGSALNYPGMVVHDWKCWVNAWAHGIMVGMAAVYWFVLGSKNPD